MKTKRLSYSLLLILLMFPAFAEAGFNERVYEATLANGLKVLLLEDHKTPVATVQIWYRVGSRNESWRKTGLSHMLEHMMFKGTTRVPAEAFSRTIQDNGGNDNAFTSNDSTVYFTNISSDRIAIPLDLESDRMTNIIFREEDFATEQMVVIEERRLRTEDNPQALLMEQLEAVAFQTHPYHWPVIGWMEDIRRFTLQDLKTYHRAHYNPANAVLIVAGDFQRDEILERIRKLFGPIPKRDVLDGQISVEPDQMGERRFFVKKEAQLACMVMGYHVPNLNDSDSYTLEVIAAVLSGGESSRLHKRLVREERLALSVDADYTVLSRDPSLFYLSADVLPGKTVADVERVFNDAIAKLQEVAVAGPELQKAKNRIEASFVFGQDSPFSQAMILGRFEMTAGWKRADEYLPAIGRVTADDILRVAKKYLVADNRTVGILLPLPTKDGSSLPTQAPTKEYLTR